MASPRFPEPPPSHPPTPLAELDATLAKMAHKKDAWVKLPLATRIGYLEKVIEGCLREAPEWAKALSRVKGIDPNTPMHGEDYFMGPTTTIRNARMLIQALKQGGQPKPPALKQRKDGQWVATVLPTSLEDRLVYAGWEAEVWIEPGKAPSQGKLYREPPTTGKISLVLAAGNVSSIGPMDSLDKLYLHGEIVMLKMNPVIEAGGPFIERAFKSLIDDGYFAVVYGGAEVGKHLTDHPLIDTIHITGSNRTHDAIIWGGSDEEQQKNKAAKTPRLTKPITSELGCVTPLLVVPGPWSDDDIDWQAQQIAGMIIHNGSFNCNAVKAVVMPKGWEHKETLAQKIEAALAKAKPRKAYYPGAQQRYQGFLDAYPQARAVGEKGEGIVPWTFIPDVPPVKGEYALSNEAFCGVVAMTEVDGKDAGEYLKNAVPFVNDAVWGSLSCMILIHPESQKRYAAAFEQAIADLRYGGIAINCWAAAIFGLCSTTWGAFPGHPLDDIQSGAGAVHNTFMFDYPQKSVMRMPWRGKPTPIWMPGHRSLKDVAVKLTEHEARPSLLNIPGIAAAAFRG